MMQELEAKDGLLVAHVYPSTLLIVKQLHCVLYVGISA